MPEPPAPWSRNPGAQVLLHTRGAAHMIRSRKLLDSAGTEYGQEDADLFGEFVRSRKSTLRIRQGARHCLLDRGNFACYRRRGHASHHSTYFDPPSVWLSGGTRREYESKAIGSFSGPNPPPDISLELWTASLEDYSRRYVPGDVPTPLGYWNQRRDI